MLTWQNERNGLSDQERQDEQQRKGSLCSSISWLITQTSHRWWPDCSASGTQINPPRLPTPWTWRREVGFHAAGWNWTETLPRRYHYSLRWRWQTRRQMSAFLYSLLLSGVQVVAAKCFTKGQDWNVPVQHKPSINFIVASQTHTLTHNAGIYTFIKILHHQLGVTRQNNRGRVVP